MDNDYERLRAEKIAQNHAKLAQLGLIETSRALMTTVRGPGVSMEAGSEAQPRKKRRVAKEAEPVVLEPTRQSSRIRGEAALSLQQAVAVGQAEAAEEEETMGRTRKGTARKRLTLEPGTEYVAPFSLWSIGVTVWDLGRIHRGAWAHRYWSSSGCLFHHAYPIGYRASKVQFGRTYEMTIEEGPTGPIFKVVDQRTGITFSGESPTKPWTDVCLAHKTGQRISGPLFFGFSDVTTQRAIAGLYTPEELQAALQGERLEGAAQTAEERAAREFRAVEGVGEATAMALAFTTRLGGAQHGSLESLRTWVQASEANQEQLRDWLTNSSELPEATRKWPAWRFRMIPKILAALSSNQSSSGSEGPGKADAEGAGKVRGGARGQASRAAVAGDDKGRQGEQQLTQEVADVAQPSGRAAKGASKVAASRVAAAAEGGGRSKENRPGNNRPSSAAAAAAAELPARTSGRQRKANSKYEQFVVELQAD